jgi:hypothetical protein
MDAVNTMYDEGAFSHVAKSKFAAYYDLERYLSDGTLRHRNHFASVYHIDALNIDLVVLNTVHAFDRRAQGSRAG